MIKYAVQYCLFFLALFMLFTSCKKDSFITSADANLVITADTLRYDTVFTTAGSVTQSFKIINNNDQKIKLDKVKLMGGTTSPYRMNVNGQAATEVNNLGIDANDSIYVFVAVTIDPGSANLPFIVSDSIGVSYNGNNRFVQLQAYGQNANFLRNKVISGNTVWTNSMPYVVLGGVRVDSTASLTIQAGCRIYSHADAPFLVDGTLVINGTKSDCVVFSGDRLDPDYRNLPAAWPGIYFRGNSRNNLLKFVIIKNAYQALVVQDPSPNPNPKLVVHQCIIDNAYDAGILCKNTSLQADNSLVSNCGSNINISYGGNYNFTSCTVAAYSNEYILHKNPVLTISNFSVQNGGTLTANLNSVFRNCIFWGDAGFVNDEVVVTKQGTGNFSVLFDRDLYRVANDPPNSSFTGIIKNADPLFDSIDVYHRYYDFRITRNAAAPGINQGVLTSFLKDLDDKNRNVGLPDLGCYEKQ